MKKSYSSAKPSNSSKKPPAKSDKGCGTGKSWKSMKGCK